MNRNEKQIKLNGDTQFEARHLRNLALIRYSVVPCPSNSEQFDYLVLQKLYKKPCLPKPISDFSYAKEHAVYTCLEQEYIDWLKLSGVMTPTKVIEVLKQLVQCVKQINHDEKN